MAFFLETCFLLLDVRLNIYFPTPIYFFEISCGKSTPLESGAIIGSTSVLSVMSIVFDPASRIRSG